jgi:hypothetical protein
MLGVLQLYQANIGPLIRFAIALFAILALWIGLARAGFTPKARTTGLVATGLLVVWLVTMEFLGRSGFYTQHWDVMRPVGWMIAILWLILLMRSETIGGVLDALPLWWLPIVQVYRAAGGLAWFVLWSAGRVPAVFGLVIGTADLLVGILAIVIGVYLYSGARGGRIAAVAWNVFGILDFANALIIGLLVPFSLAYPAVMVSAFTAPLSLILHALSLRQLLRAMKRERGAPTLANAKIA